MKFRSCNTEPCPKGQKDFREEQCSEFDGKHFNINGLPPTVRWIPKYSGILMKDQCKLFCRVAGTTAYYQLKDRVADGTQCGPETNDICVQGLCRQAGCDHVLNSKARRDKCGVCGGDNSSCKTLAGTFNSAQYGYNVVVRIPAGATSIDIRQHSYSGKPEDDNYLGERKRKAVCVRNSDHLVVSEQRCEHLPQPALATEPCNTECEQRWHVVGKSECSAKCGPGYRTQDIQCMRYSASKRQSVPVESRFCSDQLKPQVREPCHGDCHLTSWHYSSWSQCSKTCGRGTRSRDFYCVNNLGRRLVDRECNEHQRVVTQTCNDISCPEWATSEWTECLVTCGKGVRHRQVWCRLNEERLRDNLCNADSKPEAVGACELPECASWQVGVWGMCAVTCGHGYQMRAVRCVAGTHGESLDDRVCNAASRPRDNQECEMPACPESPKVFSTVLPGTQRGFMTQWRYGSWTPCSVTCGKGKRARYVSCRDAHGGVADESYCAHLPRPPEVSTCFSPCATSRHISPLTTSAPTWITLPRTVQATKIGMCRLQTISGGQALGEHNLRAVALQAAAFLSECSVSCGKGTKHRDVYCADKDQAQVEEEHCKQLSKPRNHKPCRSRRCPSWKANRWKECPVTCGEGIKTRKIVCVDQAKKSVDDSHCNSSSKPLASQKCKTVPCEYLWITGDWSQCSKSCGTGYQQRMISCSEVHSIQDHYSYDSQSVSHANCPKPHPPDIQKCNLGECPSAASWKVGLWSKCSKSCGTGYQQRMISCSEVHSIQDHYSYDSQSVSHNCPKPHPPDIQKCNLGECPSAASWKVGLWSKCSMTCGAGVMERKVECVTSKGLHSELCRPNEKPVSKAACQDKECELSTSCSDVQTKQGLTKDGEYLLRIKGKIIQIYCAEMQSEYGKEYVTLRSGQTDNYSEVYGYRLQNPYECPFNGSRRQDCLCTNDYPAAGYTLFYRVRLDVSSMRIITTDLFFTETLLGRAVPFATAGDCYSAAKCPQGQFSINLTGTGLRVSESTKWIAQGNYATVKVHRSHDGTRIYGRCGGYCGKCSPQTNSGLQVQVL
ncbi:UNVERIFIED_CONTAM: hypothetical protein FKN15_071967 [Acipenser sinensis]